VGAASADNFVSFGTANGIGGSTPSGQAGAVNSALLYLGYNPATNSPCPVTAGCTVGSGNTLNIPTGGVWGGPVPGSSWVSFTNSSPNGPDTPANGTYTFATGFTATGNETLTFTVYADDTTAIYLDGEIVPDEDVMPAPPTPAPHCTAAEPNCEMADLVTINVGDGVHTLFFAVDQDFDSAMGVDFSGNLAPTPTPEPNSLMLLGTGLLGAAGILRRRVRA
jgi:hypothetical protein